MWNSTWVRDDSDESGAASAGGVSAVRLPPDEEEQKYLDNYLKIFYVNKLLPNLSKYLDYDTSNLSQEEKSLLDTLDITRVKGELESNGEDIDDLLIDARVEYGTIEAFRNYKPIEEYLREVVEELKDQNPFIYIPLDMPLTYTYLPIRLYKLIKQKRGIVRYPLDHENKKTIIDQLITEQDDSFGATEEDDPKKNLSEYKKRHNLGKKKRASPKRMARKRMARKQVTRRKRVVCW